MVGTSRHLPSPERDLYKNLDKPAHVEHMHTNMLMRKFIDVYAWSQHLQHDTCHVPFPFNYMKHKHILCY